jgi:hypothetical protein
MIIRPARRMMYGHLRDVMGDSAFRAFFHEYYQLWRSNTSMNARCERPPRQCMAKASAGSSISGCAERDCLRLRLRRRAHDSAERRFETTSAGRAASELRHAMPVGALTSIRLERSFTPTQCSTFRTFASRRTERPQRVELDPNHVTWDWDRRNNSQSSFLISVREPHIAFNWPYLDQVDMAKTIVALAPALLVQRTPGSGHWCARQDELPVDRRHSRRRICLLVRVVRAALNGQRAELSCQTSISLGARREFSIRRAPRPPPLMGYGGAVSNFVDGRLKLDLIQEL